MTAALALLSTHPLTSERREALEALTVSDASLQPAFTPAEWQAIKTMCAPVGGSPSGVDRDKLEKNG
jgi:hypothetical protein